MNNEWLDVMAHPPKVGEWAVVLCDEQMAGDWWRMSFWPFKKPRFSVTCAYVRCINQWGGIEWERWSLASGSPLGGLGTVTHYQKLPPIPEWATDDVDLPAWTREPEENVFGRDF